MNNNPTEHMEKLSNLVMCATSSFINYLEYDSDNISLNISDRIGIKSKKCDSNIYNYSIYQDNVIMFDFIYNSYYNKTNYIEYIPGRWEDVIEKYYHYINEKIEERKIEKQKRMVREYLKNTKRK